MEVDATETSLKTSSGAGEANEKEFCLLGSPTFVDLGNGRLRCNETGHEFPAKDINSYIRTKSCRLSLINLALSRKHPPLNTFLPHPLSKSKLVCTLTGDTINKSEEHICKHINGIRFLKKLEENEVQMRQSREKIEKDGKKSMKQSNLNAISLYHQKTKAFMPREPAAESSDSEEPDFWIPAVGDHWDSDDGKVSWDSCTTTYQKADNLSSALVDEERERETLELSIRTKRMAIAVGPSSFASRKKKNKKASSPTVSNIHRDV